MSWKHHLAVRLARSTGVQITRRGGRPTFVRRPHRLLRRPVFILSSVRSGSTLLRMMLNSHSTLYAPHELHLSKLRVQMGDHYITNSMAEFGWDAQEVTHLLWDRVLDAALQRSGKQVLVEKTPHNVFMWSRIAQVWPDARFIFLLRHPAAILDSWHRARPQQTPQEAADSVAKYLTKLAEARRVLPGHTVRYEDLAADPTAETRRICAFLGLEWEPSMLEYGRFDHGTIKAGLGDWTGRIRTGTVQPPRELPADVALPDSLYGLARGWGYPARPAG
ncbi:sulfotransferase family protein [Micromonospora sp. NBC_01813]|uniref:sulfotransferase family protein n=1 Tax=Micromonospora sp. NBC_01813 TaxID=2975988 RepID=UPI002DD873E1|nr:sulfotransferase [Micromonospora sp. NBC_01813]WSA10864.1 sulfotransferase [Micromonospora sp. NBC_01813]